MSKHTFEVGEIVEVFEDVFTEKKFEGVGKIKKIHRQDEVIADCDVVFYEDLKAIIPKFGTEVVRRQIKR